MTWWQGQDGVKVQDGVDVLAAGVLLPHQGTVLRCGETETETGCLRDDAAGQPRALRPPPPAHREEGELHTEDWLSGELDKEYC